MVTGDKVGELDFDAIARRIQERATMFESVYATMCSFADRLSARLIPAGVVGSAPELPSLQFEDCENE